MMNLSSLAECWNTGLSLKVISGSSPYSPRLSGYNSAAGPELLTLTMSGRTNWVFPCSVVIVFLMAKNSPQYIRGNTEMTEIHAQCDKMP